MLFYPAPMQAPYSAKMTRRMTTTVMDILNKPTYMQQKTVMDSRKSRILPIKRFIGASLTDGGQNCSVNRVWI